MKNNSCNCNKINCDKYCCDKCCCDIKCRQCINPCRSRCRSPRPCRPKNDLFLSEYLEAVGDTQTVASNGDICFNTDPQSIDIIGNGIKVNENGSEFIITRPGLYLVEWSVNITSSSPPVTIGIMENDVPSSALSYSGTSGSHSSGTLINVDFFDLPYTVKLHNFGGALSLQSPSVFANTAASVRILRFADGARRR